MHFNMTTNVVLLISSDLSVPDYPLGTMGSDIRHKASPWMQDVPGIICDKHSLQVLCFFLERIFSFGHCPNWDSIYYYALIWHGTYT